MRGPISWVRSVTGFMESERAGKSICKRTGIVRVLGHLNRDMRVCMCLHVCLLTCMCVRMCVEEEACGVMLAENVKQKLPLFILTLLAKMVSVEDTGGRTACGEESDGVFLSSLIDIII